MSLGTTAPCTLRRGVTFLAGRLEWLDIVEVDASVVNEHEGLTDPDLEDVLSVERWARQRAEEIIARRSSTPVRQEMTT